MRALLFVWFMLSFLAVGDVIAQEANFEQAYIKFYDDVPSQQFLDSIFNPLEAALNDPDVLMLGGFGRGSSPTNIEGERLRSAYFTTGILYRPDVALPLIKGKMIELGVSEGAEIRFQPSSPWQSLTLVDGQWIPTDQVGFEFVAERMVSDAELDQVVQALVARHPARPPAAGLVSRARALEELDGYLFETRLKAPRHEKPMKIAFQKSQDGEVLVSVMSTSKEAANNIQALLDGKID
ncbi:MAG: hypothetical protein QNJ05_15460 [Woeseiaceae bacterium]|nr:hypothetical protein [Woeseiaceae bacterium]